MMAASREKRERRVGAICRVGVLLATVLVATAVVSADDPIRVTPLAREGRILLSFEMPQGISKDMSAAIHSGLTTIFTYEVELRRSMPMWFDRTIDQAIVSASVQYDNLRRRHQLSRSVNGRIEDSDVTDDEEKVRRWMTKFDQLSLFRTAGLEANAEYYVRVRVRTHPTNSLFVLPWGSGGLSGLAKFTFIP
jgi:hypothetical protein